MSPSPPHHQIKKPHLYCVCNFHATTSVSPSRTTGPFYPLNFRDIIRSYTTGRFTEHDCVDICETTDLTEYRTMKTGNSFALYLKNFCTIRLTVNLNEKNNPTTNDGLAFLSISERPRGATTEKAKITLSVYRALLKTVFSIR